MTIKSKHYLGLASAILLGFVSTGGAVGSLGVLSLGTAAPPGTLGGFSMTPIGADPSALDSMVSSVGSISFNQAVRHDQVGNGWGTWSHGYGGNVYDTGSSLTPTSLTLTMGGLTSAVYFYTESVNFSTFSFTATAADGTTLTQNINGNGGAAGFGFYGTGGDTITSITVTGTDADGFAIGEFGLNGTPSVPDSGSSLVYASLALLALFGCRVGFKQQAV
jgi:hypothetical protein